MKRPGPALQNLCLGALELSGRAEATLSGSHRRSGGGEMIIMISIFPQIWHDTTILYLSYPSYPMILGIPGFRLMAV